jgi:hypothetical protein
MAPTVSGPARHRDGGGDDGPREGWGGWCRAGTPRPSRRRRRRRGSRGADPRHVGEDESGDRGVARADGAAHGRCAGRGVPGALGVDEHGARAAEGDQHVGDAPDRRSRCGRLDDRRQVTVRGGSSKAAASPPVSWASSSELGLIRSNARSGRAARTASRAPRRRCRSATLPRAAQAGDGERGVPVRRAPRAAAIRTGRPRRHPAARQSVSASAASVHLRRGSGRAR